MAWIESHQELARHPKVRHAARLLGAPRVAIIGTLHCLWWYALDHADDDILDVDWADLTEEAQWDGDPDQFIRALCDAGWLHSAGGRKLRIHDWWEYGGKSAKAREARIADGVLGAHKRWHRNGVIEPNCPHCYSPPNSPPNGPPNGPPIGDGDPDDSPPNSPPKNPHGTGPNSPPISTPSFLDGGANGTPHTDRQTNTTTYVPVETQRDTAHVVAALWKTRPGKRDLAEAQRLITDHPWITRLNEYEIRTMFTEAKRSDTRHLSGFANRASEFRRRPPDPTWCGNCDPTARIVIDDDLVGRPCQACAPAHDTAYEQSFVFAPQAPELASKHTDTRQD